MSKPMNLATPDDDIKSCSSLCEQLVDAAKKAGASLCDATAGAGSALSAKARDGSVEDVTRSSSRGAGIRVIVDGKLGFATAAAAPSTPAEIRTLAETAVALARVSTTSAHNVIPLATGPTGKTLADLVRTLKLWDDDVAGASPAWAADAAVKAERITSAVDGISSVRDVGASTRRGVFALASSNGFVGAYGGTSVSLSVSAIADDDGGKKQTDGWWTASRHFGGLEDTESVALEAARRALLRRNAKKIPSAKMPVIYDANMARTFFGAVLSGLNGDVVSRKASFLVEKKGEVVFSRGHRIVDNPFIPSGFGSHPFDGEGLLAKETVLIDDDGRLNTYLLDARSAHQLNTSPTGHASRGSMGLPHPSSTNIVIEGGSGDLASIIKETSYGLLVTHLLGHSPDLITGEYSRGAAGFLIVDGEIAHAVEEVTVAGDMLSMMTGLDRVGADVDRRSSLMAPTIRFSELSVSGA